MTARRASSDPVSEFLQTGERVVWRHQPSSRALFFNRLPQLIIGLALLAFVGWVFARFFVDAFAGITSAPAPGFWIAIPLAFVLLGGAILVAFLAFVWRSLRSLLDSADTHYALTAHRFMIVSARGLIDYGPEFFSKMEPLGGKDGAQVLLFDWGPSGKSRRDAFRDRIAALPNAKELEALIRQTLKPPPIA